MMQAAKTAVLLGAGDRGGNYAGYALKNPEEIKITAVAEPHESRRRRIVSLHNIPHDNIFSSWEELLSKGRMADGAIIATQDSLHFKPAYKALELGYHVLLEKPMALSPDECRILSEKSAGGGSSLSICHVLRHTSFFKKIREIISSGEIGEVCAISHSENLSYHHMAHSYVRGSWGDSSSSSPIILAKCSHDFDLISWFAGSAPAKIASTGACVHFTRENAPQGCAERCTDGCPYSNSCIYNALETYLHGRHMKTAIALSDSSAAAALTRFMLKFPGLSARIPFIKKYSIWKEWPTSTITENLSKEGINNALKTGPYGRCVYLCGGNQPDRQHTLIEFKNGINAVLNLQGHSSQEYRALRIDGTRGSLRGTFGSRNSLEIIRHGSYKKITLKVPKGIFGHSEGDSGIMKDFISVLNGGRGGTSGETSLISHQMAFAAEKSRLSGRIINL